MLAPTNTRCQQSSLAGLAPAACRHVPPRFAAIVCTHYTSRTDDQDGRWHLPAAWHNPPARCCRDDLFILLLRQHEQSGPPLLQARQGLLVPSEQVAWYLAARCDLYASQSLQRNLARLPLQAVEGLAGAVGEGAAIADKATGPGGRATEGGAGVTEGGAGEAGVAAQLCTVSCHDSVAGGGGSHDTQMPAQHAESTAAVPAPLEELMTVLIV